MNKTLKKVSRPPPPPAHRNLEAFIFLNERGLQQQKLMEPRFKNLSREEKGALRELKRNPHITIKEADKGGAVVILDTADYVAEADRQLSTALLTINPSRRTPPLNIPHALSLI